MSKPATILDVAKEAGLSIKTVSRVLNDEPHVRPATREKVFAAVKALNYKPNISARSLAGTRSYIIGLLYRNPSPAYVMSVQEGVLNGCEARGYNLLIHPCEEEGQQSIVQYVDQLMKRSKLDGIILIPPLSDNEKLLKRLARDKVKHVRISQLDFSGFPPCISSNELEVSTALTQRLISLGHERIAIVKGPADHGGSQHRFKGFMAAMKEAGLKLPANFIQQGDFTFESGLACAEKLLRYKKRPSAIFACNDYMAAGVMSVAHRLGLAVPAELSIVGFDDAPVSRQIWPSLTTVRQPVRQLATQAAVILIKKIQGQPLQESIEPMECEIILRNSTGPAPAE